MKFFFLLDGVLASLHIQDVLFYNNIKLLINYTCIVFYELARHKAKAVKPSPFIGAKFCDSKENAARPVHGVHTYN